MAIHENLVTFAGRPVKDWEPGAAVGDPRGVAYRVGLSYDDAEAGSAWAEKLESLLADPAAGRVEALVVGAWGEVMTGSDSAPVVEALAAARKRLPGLRHLFLGDITMEESEISWIVQSDLSPLFEAYPALEHLTVRGGQSLGLGTPRHASLRELVVQSGGLPREVVHEISAADLPALERLELWLGDPGYGGDATVEDLAPLLKGDRFPKLVHLGLKNSEIQDEIAAAVAVAPLTARLRTLDLSMGTLGDAGATALIGSPAVRRLEKLDIHHHFVSDALVDALKSCGPEVDATEPQEPQEWGGESHRFVAVSE